MAQNDINKPFEILMKSNKTLEIEREQYSVLEHTNECCYVMSASVVLQ